ncbi:hypothetical protein GUJ93_ZPchr0014g47637 [Zizania palustris]|uniref:Uncharacterized protein n=1 Tax=Zizania palustris TaxID=103762 RepID=A0A8J5W6X7_ZIZPA|nr:hypothetical protein GUJ93_ZPchr0014g47637 [Zizania palustris]
MDRRWRENTCWSVRCSGVQRRERGWAATCWRVRHTRVSGRERKVNAWACVRRRGGVAAYGRGRGINGEYARVRRGWRGRCTARVQTAVQARSERRARVRLDGAAASVGAQSGAAIAWRAASAECGCTA